MKVMARKFKTGDVVRLASDTEENTPMTVRGYVYDFEVSNPLNAMLKETLRATYEGLVRCDWRDKNDVPHQKDYHEDELVKF